MWRAHKGLHFDDTSGAEDGPEGGLIVDCVSDSDIGIFVESTHTEPRLDIIRCHTNCSEMGIQLVKKKLVHIESCVLYNEESDPYIDIDLQDCNDVTIDNVTFHEPTIQGAYGDRININVDEKCKRIFLQKNKHRCRDTAMMIEGSDSNNAAEAYLFLDPTTTIS